VGVEEFMARLGELDAPMLAKLEAARARNRVLRYVGALDAASNRPPWGLVELEKSHPFANINLTDNVVAFVTSRYDQNPLVVQGPGAGPGRDRRRRVRRPAARVLVPRRQDLIRS
jgi:aspartokinase/homoserine dehydrogenase 1